MDVLRDFFQRNSDLVYFVYGQVFVMMGLAVALSSRQRTRLDLGRHLWLLAAFGLTHGLVEFGYIFIPMHASNDSPDLDWHLWIIHCVLKAVSFFFLFQFGVRLLVSGSFRWRWANRIPGLVLISWTLWFFAAAGSRPPLDLLMNSADILGRYTMSLPGAILTAFGLLRQSRSLALVGWATSRANLRGAAVSFSAYAVFGGFMVSPPGPSTPEHLLASLPSTIPLALVLNSGMIVGLIGIPMAIFRSAAGVAIAFFVIRALEVFALETDQTIEDMERERILSLERERISRELHDGIIQTIYAAGLILEDVQFSLQANRSEAQGKLQRAMQALDLAVKDIRSYIFELRTCGTCETLEAGLQGLANEMSHGSQHIEVTVEGSASGILSERQRFHLLQAAREALANAIRHSHAGHIGVCLDYRTSGVRLQIADDGVGYHPAGTPGSDGRQHYGMANMAARLRQVSGSLRVDSPSQGTRVQFEVPYAYSGNERT